MTLELTPAAYDDPIAAALIEAVQREYEARYEKFGVYRDHAGSHCFGKELA